jgi:hypothetical protein
MATVKKQSLLLLDNDAILEDFFEYTDLYGLKFSEEPYYCAWFLNEHLGTNFVRNKNFFRENTHGFDLYEYNDLKISVQHLLYTNNLKGNFMIRELRGFQYLWMVKGEDNSLIYMASVQQQFKKFNGLVELQKLDLDKITDKGVFLF